MNTPLTDRDTYNAAAHAITDGALEVYEAIKAAAPSLDWSGHDRRAALARGATLKDLGSDPALNPYREYIPVTVPLRDEHVKRCMGCGALIYWGVTREKAHPFDVDSEGRGTSISHFQTCPNAEDFRPTKGKTTKRRKSAA